MKTINIAPKMILVDGQLVASTLSGFKNYIIKNKINVATDFRNWPFIVGLSSNLENKKVHFWD